MRPQRPLVSAAAALVTAGLPAAGMPAAALAATPQPHPRFAPIRAGLLAPFPAERNGYVASTRECTVGREDDSDRADHTFSQRDRDRANLNLDCDNPKLPNNEPHIAVDPADRKHLVASSNDYDSNGDEFYTSFDGGRTWLTGNMSLDGSDRLASDPVTSFDVKHDVVLHASINFRLTPERLADDGDIVVSRSTDRGKTWRRPVEVYSGQGSEVSPVQVFNDKEWIVTDNTPSSPFFGRTYVTWSRFLSRSGRTLESPIWLASSDDGGRTWSAPREISGSSPTCTHQDSGPAYECDESQFSVPAVAPDGTLYVAFENDQHQAAWEAGEKLENQYLVVCSSNGAATFTSPVSVVDLEDGSRDSPVNVNNRQTLTGFQARVNSGGNIVVNPRNGEVALVFSDNRAGRHDVADPGTDTHVYLMRSADRGRTWRGPVAVTDGPGGQWFPWIDVNPKTGRYGVVYSEGTGDGRYATAYAVEHDLGFRSEQISTTVSNARDALFFRANTPACPHCTRFFGDYVSLAYGRDGTVHLVWTDMRRQVSYRGEEGHTEDIFYTSR